MNELQLKGQWKYLRGKVRERWSRLTDDDMGIIGGQQEQLIGLLQKRYGILQEEAERQLHEFLQDCASRVEESKAA